MKNASVILSHLVNQPQFKYLKQQECYRKFISLLGQKWQKAIAFVYVKNETLFVTLTHPGFKMELHYNRDLLKSVLTQLASHDEACHTLQVKNVTIFHSKYYPPDGDKHTEETVPYYHELAEGSFDIQSDDPDLISRFTQIKQRIQCNR